MRISDWSSDVCSSDLLKNAPVEYFRKQVRLGGCRRLQCPCRLFERGAACAAASARGGCHNGPAPEYPQHHRVDRKSVVEGKCVSVRVDMGGRRKIKKKKLNKQG